jgi:hypothetical protein
VHWAPAERLENQNTQRALQEVDRRAIQHRGMTIPIWS